MRRQLKEKRDELRAMLSKVDRELTGLPSAAGSERSAVDAVSFAHMPRSEQLRLAQQSGFTSAKAPERFTQRIEVPTFIRERFREEYNADPEAFRKTWEQQTPEFRKNCAEMALGKAKPPTPMPAKPPTPKPPGSALSDTDALLRKAEGGGRAHVSGARAAQSQWRMA